MSILCISALWGGIALKKSNDIGFFWFYSDIEDAIDIDYTEIMEEQGIDRTDDNSPRNGIAEPSTFDPR